MDGEAPLGMKDLYDAQFIEEMKQEEEVIVPLREYEEKCDMKELIGVED